MNKIVERLKSAGIDCFSDLAAWKSWQSENEAKLAARWLIAQRFHSALDGTEYDGWCELCGTAVRFGISDTPQSGEFWFFREDVICNSCGMMARLRLGAVLLRHLLPPADSAIYVNEQLSALYPWLLRNFADVVGSEYVPNLAERSNLKKRLKSLLRGQSRQRLVHEDATALSFPDGRFSALMSFDVLEHIPDYHAALHEFARVLRPDGIAILTAPFLDNTQETRVRARHLADGTLEHLLPPEYHGDPLADDHQVLCYQDFGWDILEALRSAGFSEAWTVSHWNLAAGFPSQLTAWVARR